MTNPHSYTVSFGSKEHSIDSEALIASLIALKTTVDEINLRVSPSERIEVSVKPFQPGSFEIPFDLIQVAQDSLLATTPIITEIVGVLKEFIELKVLLKGESPDKVEKENGGTRITTQSGNVINIGHIAGDVYLNSPNANSTFDRSMAELLKNEEINDYKILDSERKPLVQVNREDFSNFKPYEKIENEQKKSKLERTRLSVFKIVFDTKYKWDFLYQGIKIPAKILDQEFQKKILNGERFAHGDTLDVELKINQSYDEVADTFMNKSYEVLRVIKHWPRGIQTDLGI